jgi:hypothetical protein
MSQSSIHHRACKVATIMCAAALMTVGFVAMASGQSDPVPTEIRDLKMGSPSSVVIGKISPSGPYSTDKLPKEDERTILTWKIPDNIHYKDVSFTFTEKDRLFLIRFNLKEGERDEIQALKKSFFDTQKFLWEDPLKLKVKDDDILLYIKDSGPDCFLDFSNKKTGERAFELFDRAISAEDRPQKPAQEKLDNQKAGETEGAAKEPEAQDAKPSEQEKASDSGKKSAAEKAEAKPQQESK